MSALPRRRWVQLLLQLLGSAVVILLLLRHVELGGLREALARVDPLWLLLLLPVKAASSALHEFRLYLALLPWGRPPFARVMGIGFTTGLINTVIPMRGGDLLAIALLRLECRVRTAAAITAVGLASVVEALVFGAALLLVLAVQGPGWARELTSWDPAQLTHDLGLLTAAATMIGVGLVILLRFLHRRRQATPGGPGLLNRLAELGQGLDATSLGINTGLAVVQVAFVFGTLLVLFQALGIDPRPTLLAAGLIQATGSVAATVLPHSFGASQAASAVLVLAMFGVPTAPALALAALMWAAHQLVTLLLGALPLWRRLGALAELRRDRPTGSA
jgi:hypothetical protein